MGVKEWAAKGTSRSVRVWVDGRECGSLELKMNARVVERGGRPETQGA